MKLIELHILQSFPVSCLNRDDVGAPKTATFGGVTRARISSQCLKRAIREGARDLLPAFNQGIRTRYIIPLFVDALVKAKVGQKEAEEAAKQVATFFNDVDAKKDPRRVKTAMFISPREVAEMAGKLAEAAKKGKISDDSIKEACILASRMDAADIAIFGRMVANDSSVGVEAAGMFSHALSTHSADNDFDFFSAVDEHKPADVPGGAAITDVLQFSSATYYRYAALNLSWLTDPRNLCSLVPLSKEQRREVVRTFLRATVEATPGARKNSMNAHNPAAYALGVFKEKGQPTQLVNAFEEPVWSKNGYLQPSVRKLLIHNHRMKEMFGDSAKEEIATGFAKAEPDDGEKKDLTATMIPKHVSLEIFCERLSTYVE